jgi:Holliday junction resolvase
MVSRAKGLFYERELFHFLKSKEFAVTRVAGSGHGSPLDILAIKKGVILGFEVKAHSNKPKLKKEKISELRDWCEKAGALGFLAWRAPQKNWLFLPIEKMEKNNYEDEHWLELESFLAAVDSE